MRVRSILITAAVGVAFAAGSITAAHANPQGPGGIKNGNPTPTTAAPKPADKLAPKPTPTTTPPKGPGDLAPAPPKGDNPKPKGPGDLAPAPPKGDNPKPKGPGDIAPKPNGGGVVPGPDTTGNGSGADNYVPPADGTGGADAIGNADIVPAAVTAESSRDAAPLNDAPTKSTSMPVFVIVFFVLVLAGLAGVVVARLRSDDEDRAGV